MTLLIATDGYYGVKTNATAAGRMNDIYKREDGSLIFIKYAGGWGYESSCGRFTIINLSKCDRRENGPSKGWDLVDKRTQECGRYITLKSAKEAAERVKHAEEAACAGN